MKERNAKRVEGKLVSWISIVKYKNMKAAHKKKYNTIQSCLLVECQLLTNRLMLRQEVSHWIPGTFQKQIQGFGTHLHNALHCWLHHFSNKMRDLKKPSHLKRFSYNYIHGAIFTSY